MSAPSAAVVPLLVGVAFGWLLDRARLTRHERIVGVYELTDLAVLKFLGTAIIVGALVVQAAVSLGFVAVVPVTATRLVADLVGGALLGAAMAVGGFCPGTIVAGAATGRLDALVPGIAGLVVGALLYGRFAATLAPLLAGGDRGALTVPRAIGVSGKLVTALLVELAALGFYALERHARRAPR